MTVTTFQARYSLTYNLLKRKGLTIRCSRLNLLLEVHISAGQANLMKDGKASGGESMWMRSFPSDVTDI